jgi:Flp pilus assembly protein TadD
VIELLDGNDAQAVEYGEKAWALRKDSPSIAANLAIAYHYLGDSEKRDALYRHSAELGYADLATLQEIFTDEASIR